MKKFLMAAIAVFMMAGTAVASESIVAVENSINTVADENVADKMIALIKDYTKKIEAAETMETLDAVYKEFEQAMATFSKDNAAEIAKFDAELTGKMKEKYEAELSKVMKQFESALEKKAMKFLGE